MTNTQDLLTEARRLNALGFSVVPFSVKYPDKKPFGSEWQKKKLSDIEIGEILTTVNHINSIGIACGSISNNLHIVDIDSKYKPGIEVLMTKEIQEFYPEIYKKFRVVKTRSGGLHWMYFLENTPPGNKKIAEREATEEELKTHPKTKKYAFIETRGEGGAVVTYPSEGYELIQDIEPGTLTDHEFESLMALCRSYNEVVQVKREQVHRKREVSGAYDESPFEAYNRNVNPDELALQLGFTYFKGNHKTIHYTRQGKKSGTSLIWNCESRTFWSFTVNSALEDGVCYSPSKILIDLFHGGDTKAAFRDLVNRGYGKYRPDYEEKLIQKVVHGRAQAPNNLSQEAKIKVEELVQTINLNCPYGIFWVETDKGILIDREQFMVISEQMGFRLHRQDVVRELCGFIHRIPVMGYYDIMKNYINCDDADLQNDIYNAYELFIERHGKFVISRMTELDTNKVLRDTRTKCYKHYQNGTLIITQFDCTFVESVDGLIWMDSVHDRNFYQVDKFGIYYDYLHKAVGISDYLQRFIGHLCHEYKDGTIGYISILSEVVNDPKLGGGSGKNLFFNLLSYSTSVLTRPGEGVKVDETLLQSWKGENIFVLSDPEKSFPISKLKDYATNDAVVKYLYKNAQVVKLEDMPKLGIATNFSFDIKDGGLKRRLRFLEFTDYFTIKGGVDAEYGMLFPDGWSEEDWAGYDCFIAMCIMKWLQGGCKLEINDLSESGWEKQFEQTFGNLYYFIRDNIGEWIENGVITNEVFKSKLLLFYEENNTPKPYQASMQKINKALEAYCSHYGYDYIPDVSTQFGKGRRFGRKGKIEDNYMS